MQLGAGAVDGSAAITLISRRYGARYWQASLVGDLRKRQVGLQLVTA